MGCTREGRESQGGQGEESNERTKIKKKYTDKGKATIGEKQSGTIELGSSSRKKERVAKTTYQVVLHDDDFNSIMDRVYDSMTEPITTFTTTQEAMKKIIEAQLMELKSLVSHVPHVVIPTLV